jgi:hypothetical protein
MVHQIDSKVEGFCPFDCQLQKRRQVEEARLRTPFVRTTLIVNADIDEIQGVELSACSQKLGNAVEIIESRSEIQLSHIREHQ